MKARFALFSCLLLVAVTIVGCSSSSDDKATTTPTKPTAGTETAGGTGKAKATPVAGAPEPTVNSDYNMGVGTKSK